MKSPEGEDMPMRGVYLEVVKNEKIVFTDAYNRAWEPSDKPFFTGIVTFEDAKDEKWDGKTRYTARALHWTAEDCEAHEQMGFHEAWGQVAEQLAALAKTLFEVGRDSGAPPTARHPRPPSRGSRARHGPVTLNYRVQTGNDGGVWGTTM